MKLFVYETPEATPTDYLPDCAVVIDVLRATTTIATVLAAGAEAVQAFSDIEELMDVSAKWETKLRLRAGERGGAKVEGCDLGNSPLDCTCELVKGKRFFLSTTNGTRALHRVENSSVVLTAAFVNDHSVIDYLKQEQPETVWLVCSGWQGSYSLEDTACAGKIASLLLPPLSHKIAKSVGNDEVIGAIALYSQWQDNLLELFHLSSHGQRLLRLGQTEDLAYCAQQNVLKVIPTQKEPSILV
ncbi:2-phosphosulfolactate phosphatase family protein [Euhalothece natronophila Z-M001]|uniref:Probable 2-phosphosulfolactate phosphatase n=1 Tax=Euhalothece natronophila Z-M001 TaxID=522448 RepID=A0A5B8NNF7_9CHRO|nr:2-phosphosulfolactate phosphatase family protein [Euhalothece natronophila]QDZ39699.1 2-phosphosulfolactate phosphatase family protein [Euhalothece natronophila Z-M001]